MMTSRQTASHILAVIIKIAEDKKEDVSSMCRAGLFSEAIIAEAAVNILLDVAAGLSSAIEDGEYGEK